MVGRKVHPTALNPSGWIAALTFGRPCFPLACAAKLRRTQCNAVVEHVIKRVQQTNLR